MEKLMNEVGTGSYNRSGRAQLLLSNAKYEGHKLETGFRLEDQTLPEARAWQINSKSARRGHLCPAPKWGSLSDLYTITPAQVECVIIDDLPQTTKSKTIGRIKQYVNDQPQAKSILIFRGRDGKPGDVTTLLKMLRGPTNVVMTSTLPEPLSVAKAPKGTRPRVRMFTFNGTDDRYTQRPIQNLAPAYSKANAVAEIAYADQPASGIMVVMNAFDLPADFHQKMGTGIIKFDELVFVNAVDAPKLKTAFRDFEEVFDERLNKMLSACPDLAVRLGVYADSNLRWWFDFWTKTIAGRITLNPAQQKRPFGRIVELYETYVKPLTSEQLRLFSVVKVALPKGLDSVKLIEKMRKEQEDAMILVEELRLSKDKHVALLAKHL